MSTILNTLPANIALLDEKGFIIEINDAWRNFADDNGFIGANYGVGENYITISKNACGSAEKDGKAVTSGIISILENNQKEFIYEYTCDSPNEQRWFRMVVTPLQKKEYAGAVVMHIDISQLRKLEKERLDLQMDEQKKITRAIIKGQEIERNAIGVELHDNVNQILVGTKLFLSMVKDDPVANKTLVSNCIATIQDAINENRKIAHALVAPDFDVNEFSEQLTRLTDTMLKASGINVQIETINFDEKMINDEQKLAAYRITQEQCTNIVKYAKAGQVTVSLSTGDNTFRMIIADDGLGMEKGKKAKGIGLRNIKSRLSTLNGTDTIKTAPGKGFALEITMPLKNTSQS